MRLIGAVTSLASVAAVFEFPLEFSGNIPVLKDIKINGVSLNFAIDTSSSYFNILSKAATNIDDAYEYPAHNTSPLPCTCRTAELCGSDSEFKCNCVNDISPEKVFLM